MAQKKLRCVFLYSSGHLGSTTVLNQLQQMKEFEIVGLVRADTISLDKKGLEKVQKQHKKLGWRFTALLVWQRIIQMLMFCVSRCLPFSKKIRPAWALTAKHDIPVLNCTSINSESARQWIEEREPDIILSAYFTQILKQPVIDIPKIGVLNIHPGWLPSYRGAMAYFWALHNQESHAGVSVHWIDEGIDTGQLLARKKIRLNKRSTQERVLYCTAMIGARLVRRIARQILRGEQPPVIDTSKETAHYYAMPKRSDFLHYWQQHRFFRIRDILSFLLCRQRS